VHAWWYVLWEHLWQHNSAVIPQFKQYEHDFSPLYPTSIAYRPMGRDRLQKFLWKRQCWNKHGFFHDGFANKIYEYLNSVVFGAPVRDADAV